MFLSCQNSKGTFRLCVFYNHQMNTKQQIKHLLVMNDMTMTELCKRMSEKLGKPYSIYNISGKLNRDTIKYSEIKMLYNILGYELVLRKK